MIKQWTVCSLWQKIVTAKLQYWHNILVFFLISEEFDNYLQQDAHEFLNFLINHINEVILCEYFPFFASFIQVFIHLQL